MEGVTLLQFVLPNTLTIFHNCALACSMRPSMLLLTSSKTATCILGAAALLELAATCCTGILSVAIEFTRGFLKLKAAMEPVTSKTAAARINSLFINLVCKPDALYILLHKKVRGTDLFLIYFNKKHPPTGGCFYSYSIDPLDTQLIGISCFWISLSGRNGRDTSSTPSTYLAEMRLAS